MKKKNMSIEEQLKKYKKMSVLAFSLLAAFMLAAGAYIYLNYDYLAFKHFITGFYIYTDALDELYKTELQRDVGRKYYSYFDNVVISVLTKRIREINNDRYTYLYTPERYNQEKQEEKKEAMLSEVKVLDEKTVYLRLTNFSKYTEEFVRQNTEQLKKRPNIIIDLRDNYGGDIDAMVRISGLFLPEKSVIATDRMRLFKWVYKSKGKRVLDFEKIIILQNKNTASSSENMICALKDNLDEVTVMGETSYGKGIGQYTLPLKRGFAVKATILLWYTPKGANIQGAGIVPDIIYTGEDMVEHALKILNKRT